MKHLINLKNTAIGTETKDTVNARELHTFLGVGRDFSNWVKGRIDQYQFLEGEDFPPFWRTSKDTAYRKPELTT